MKDLRSYVVRCAIDVTEGTPYKIAAEDIVKEFGISMVKAEMFLDLELNAIDMNLYVEGTVGVDKPDWTHHQAIYW